MSGKEGVFESGAVIRRVIDPALDRLEARVQKRTNIEFTLEI